MKYFYKLTDCGIQGDSFEKAIKHALNRKNADFVSAQGKADFRFHNKNYEVKQNGTVIQYSPNEAYIKGSNRVIYASHIEYQATIEGDTIAVEVDLANTQMFVVDKNEFVNFLIENGLTKPNKTRGCVNIQTGYNYKKNAYHGRVGKKIEAWCYENELDDDIIGEILDNID